MANLCLSGRSPVDLWCVVVQIHVEDADDHKGEDCCYLVMMNMVIDQAEADMSARTNAKADLPKKTVAEGTRLNTGS